MRIDLRVAWTVAVLAGWLSVEAATKSQPAAAPQLRPRAWMGVSLDLPEVNDSRQAAIDAGEPLGVLITGVVKDSPADQAGLRAGDVVLRMRGEPLSGPKPLMARIAQTEPDEWIDLEVLRRGSLRRISTHLTLRPERESAWVFKQGFIGVVGVEVPTQLRAYWGAREEEGILVGEVTERSPAEIGGMLPGDLILQVDGAPVSTGQELERRIQLGGVGNEIDVLVSRQGLKLTLSIEVQEQPEEQGER
ncbi:MAG: PDZ domain-containing protein [Acidobacteriota bacterium]